MCLRVKRECLMPYTRSLISRRRGGACPPRVPGQSQQLPTTEISLSRRVGCTPARRAGSISSGFTHRPQMGRRLVPYYLVDAQGHATELELNPGLAAQWGEPRGLDRRKVLVDGNLVAGGRLRVRSTEPVARGCRSAVAASYSPDRLHIPSSLPSAQFPGYCGRSPILWPTYIQWTTGATYSSLDHYWRELPYNQMNVSGSTLVGRYTVPQPLSHIRCHEL